MNHRRTVLTLLMGIILATGLAVPVLAAEDGENAQDQARRHRRGRGPVRGLIRVIQPTEEQRPQLKEILQEQKQALDAWREQHKGEFKALQERAKKAREAGDTEALKEIRKEFKALHDNRAELHKSLVAKLEKVLTDEQMKRAQAYFKSLHPRPRRSRDGRAGRGGMGDRLGLSDEQKEKAKAILQAAREQAKQADSPEEKREIMQAARKKVHDEVLTDEQKQKAREQFKNRMGQRRNRMANRMGMTGEQKEKAKAILQAAREQAKQADSPEEKREIMQAARKKVHDEVLTDEQRSKLRPRRGRRGPGEDAE